MNHHTSVQRRGSRSEFWGCSMVEAEYEEEAAKEGPDVCHI